MYITDDEQGGHNHEAEVENLTPGRYLVGESTKGHPHAITLIKETTIIIIIHILNIDPSIRIVILNLSVDLYVCYMIHSSVIAMMTKMMSIVVSMCE